MTQSVYYGFAKQLFESVLLKGDLVDIAHLKSATSYKQVSSSLPSGSPKIRTISFILLITSLVFFVSEDGGGDDDDYGKFTATEESVAVAVQ